MILRDLIQLVEAKTGLKAKRSGRSYSCRCPSHDDNKPSLSISESEDGKLLIKCHAGCSVESICQALDLSTRDLFSDPFIGKEQNNYTPVSYYDYMDEGGGLLFRKVRHYPKAFHLEGYESGQWTHGLGKIRKVLYRLPELRNALENGEQICIAEGEKDVENLRSLGFTATTNFDGAGKWSDSYTKVLEGAQVILFYDYDTAGIKHRDVLIQKLKPVVKSLKVIDLGYNVSEKHGKDISDWLSEGHSKEELFKLIEASCEACQKYALKVVSFHELLKMPIPNPKLFLSPFIYEGSTGMIYAKRGVGKTMFGLELAYAMSSGSDYLSYTATSPVRVLYIDGEMRIKQLQQRLSLIEASEILKPKQDYFLILNQLCQEMSLPSLGTIEFASLVNPIVDRVDVVFIDNLSTLVTKGDENEGRDWTSVQNWILELRKKNKAVVIIHHANKGGHQRGTSRREDTLDYVINLSHPENYLPEEGAKFVIQFEKQREFLGEDVSCLEAWMHTSDEEKRSWSFGPYTGAKEKEIEKARAMKAQGVSVEQISKESGIPRSTLYRKLKEAESPVSQSHPIEDETLRQDDLF